MDMVNTTNIVELSREGYSRQGIFVCFKVEVKYNNETNYLTHHCYNYVNGKVVYSDGNEIIGVKDGILAYLGNNELVQRYFEQIARHYARKYFEEKSY